MRPALKVDSFTRSGKEEKWRNSLCKPGHVIFFLRTVTGCALIVLFLWQSWETVDKYRAGKTSMQVDLFDVGDILFPSITFCKESTFDKQPGVLAMITMNKTPSQIRTWAEEHTWARPKVFNFMSHQNVLESSFPCNTIAGSGKPGYPCTFPYNYPDCSRDKKTRLSSCLNPVPPEMILYTGCTSRDASEPWCIIKTFSNKSVINRKEWGYCSSACTGQTTRTESRYNLAGEHNDALWQEALYDMDLWAAGHCHTYNPPKKSGAGINGRLYALLGNIGMDQTADIYKGFRIYLHERGQFWPGLEMEKTGQSDPLHLDPDTQWEGSFFVVQKTYLSKERSPCNGALGYSYSSCIFNYIAREVGCHLDWFKGEGNFSACSTPKDMLRYSQVLTWALTSRWLDLAGKTGCLAKCKVRKFSFVKTLEEKVTWTRNWSAAFYLEVKSTAFENQEEFWAFDIYDTINGIGGVMGLCLGWSVFHLLAEAFRMMEIKILKRIM